MEVLLFETVSGKKVTSRNSEIGAFPCVVRTMNATPTTTPDAPTKPNPEAPPEESPTVAPPSHSPWPPATKPHECPRPDQDGLPFCFNNTIPQGVRRSD